MQNGILTERCTRAAYDGFEALDRSTAEGGFWYELEEAYASMRLGVRGDQGVSPPRGRYTAFGLAGALRAHRATGLGNRDKMRKTADWVVRCIESGRMEVGSIYYGGFWALMEAAVTFNDEHYVLQAKRTLQRTEEAFLSSPSLDYGCAVLGGAEYLLHGGDDTRIIGMIERKAKQHADAINARGIPATGDRRAPYHQRIMYSTWGLAALARVNGREDFANAAQRLLTFVTENRVDEDGGIRWHALWEPGARPTGAGRFYPYGHNLYYECHQCFYANAVGLYQEATGDERYAPAAEKATAWIFGENRWGYDLTTLGVPGLAVRSVTRGGKLNAWRNRWKGCYEVGAYLWAMSTRLRERLSES